MSSGEGAPAPKDRLACTLSGKHLAHANAHGKSEPSQCIPRGIAELSENLEDESDAPVAERKQEVASELPEAHPPTRPEHKFRGVELFKNLAIFTDHKGLHFDSSNESVPHESLEAGDDHDDLAEPNSLAHKIKELIVSLSLPYNPASSPPNNIKTPARDDDGRPVPPPSAVPIKDKKLIALLSDDKVMNGNGRDKPSVWTVLDSLGAPHRTLEIRGDSLGEGKDSGDTPNKNGPARNGSGADGTMVVTLGDASIMLYVPLVPTEESQVELANSKLVSVTSTNDEAHPAGKLTKDQTGMTHAHAALKWWPFKKKHETVPNNATPDNHTQETPSAGSSNPKAPAPAQTPAVQKKVWLPSTTKISIHALWWGYRIFLPPPVLAILSDKEIEAIKRANMISTALAWFFSHLPVALFPPPMQPVLLLLQKIVPYVSYIGTFISWSWNSIKSFDVGYGVILNATWVLPVALIPSTWQSYSYPAATSTPGKSAMTSAAGNTPASTPSPSDTSLTTGSSASPVSSAPGGLPGPAGGQSRTNAIAELPAQIADARTLVTSGSARLAQETHDGPSSEATRAEVGVSEDITVPCATTKNFLAESSAERALKEDACS